MGTPSGIGKCDGVIAWHRFYRFHQPAAIGLADSCHRQIRLVPASPALDLATTPVIGGVPGRAVVAGFDGGTITSDAGALLLGATDRAIGLVRRFAACFVDHRAAAQVEHSLATLVGQRVFALALGYEDLLDHDTLRHDPVLARAPLADKSTLNRLEHAPAAAQRTA